jgi:hypothetical protein
MALNTRMVPAGGPGGQITGWAGPNDNVAGRRYYTCASGSFVDVPGDPSGDAAALASQGFIPVAMSGPTSSRPTSSGILKVGALYLDTTLNVFVVWTGSGGWVNPITGAAA